MEVSGNTIILGKTSIYWAVCFGWAFVCFDSFFGMLFWTIKRLKIHIWMNFHWTLTIKLPLPIPWFQLMFSGVWKESQALSLTWFSFTVTVALCSFILSTQNLFKCSLCFFLLFLSFFYSSAYLFTPSTLLKLIFIWFSMTF